jgi:dTDP-glucose 4,6-dehydratase
MHRVALVTGGAGFIGSNFVRYFLDNHTEDRVIVLDAFTYAGNIRNLADLLTNPRLRIMQGNICDRSIVDRAMAGCDWVLNFAAETHVDRSIMAPEIFVQTDVIGTYTLLEAARMHGVQRFIQISTDEVYGEAQDPDGTSRSSLETDSLNPHSPYAASKAGADRLAFSYWATYRLPVVITRSSNNYGPYQHPEKQIPLFITNAINNRHLPIYGNGQNTRDWLHVVDHCRALDLLLTSPPDVVNGEVFNIGSGEERSVLENASLILELLKKSQSLLRFVPDRLGHVYRHGVCTGKLCERVGWRPQIPFRQGLEQTVMWYLAQSDWLSAVLVDQDDFLKQALFLAER